MEKLSLDQILSYVEAHEQNIVMRVARQKETHGIAVYVNKEEELTVRLLVKFGEGYPYPSRELLPSILALNTSPRIYELEGVWTKPPSNKTPYLYRLKILACQVPFLGDVLDEDWDIDDYGIVHNPGKFEGEPFWVVLYYEVMLNGFQDDDVGDVAIFTVTHEDKIAFPELAACEYVGIRVRDDGFVIGITGDALPVEYGGVWEPEEMEDEDAID